MFNWLYIFTHDTDDKIVYYITIDIGFIIDLHQIISILCFAIYFLYILIYNTHICAHYFSNNIWKINKNSTNNI